MQRWKYPDSHYQSKVNQKDTIQEMDIYQVAKETNEQLKKLNKTDFRKVF